MKNKNNNSNFYSFLQQTIGRLKFYFIFTVISVPCDHETLTNGNVTYTLDGITHRRPVHGVIRIFNCDTGFTIDEDEPSLCDAGNWTRGLPNCRDSRCCIPPHPSYGRFKLPNNYYYTSNTFVTSGTTLAYRCSSGYFKCLQIKPVCKDGEWEPNIRNLCVPSKYSLLLPYRRCNLSRE
ncbi:Sushi, von Willebrand factor type A, EGF and pentraxin domain-containing protein 1 [Holothuria leucospilota]|uniref:Sushi, von Willebrand factor type A, EGF and pentraxin domain-containing protein 1 n=1 Tax=Holothuria leucospilota TaxID=206669 RepID=A0A9Q1H791_HOLLE|nr:Sushi, von Willebrand factor type A, EGF and pentraxin domain-containing protein 1 [Holothuria leucospilota]